MEYLRNVVWFWLPGNLSQLFHLTLALILTSVALKAIQLFQTRQKLLKVFRDFPGPPSHWLYGHIHMLKHGVEVTNVLKWTKEFPQCFPVWYGPFLAFFTINHPEYVKAVCSRGDPKCSIAYNFLVPWIGRGLLVLNGPKWQQHRKLLTPGFHYEILKSYVTPMAESVKVMLDKWEKLVQEDPEVSVEMFEHVSLMTLDSIMKCAFSVQSNCQMDRDNSYIKIIFELTLLISLRTLVPPYYSDLIYWFSSQGRQFRKACKLAHLHTDKVIKERQEVLKNEQELEKTQKKRHLDFLDILLCAKDEEGNPLSDEDLRAEVDTFMFGGHDTVSSGISWLFYCMAQNPEHQQRCREEIKELVGDQETIQWDNLGKMTYTTMCIKESLRLYSPGPVTARLLSSPLTFHDGRTLPEGFLVALNIFGLHRNPEVWDSPEVFEPMRFSPENSSLRHPYAFMPFAAGSRNCIGQQFAMIELKLALALTLLRFELKPDPAKPSFPMIQIITKSMSGIHLKLKKLFSHAGTNRQLAMEGLRNAVWFWFPGNLSQLFHLTLALILTSVALKAIQLFQTTQKLLKGFRDFPGPLRHWLYGHIHLFKLEEDLKNLVKWTERFPQCFPIWYGPFLAFFVINHPEYAKAVLSRGDPKNLLVYNLLIPWIGRGLLILNGPKWQQHRKLLTPGFHYEILKSYVTPMAESVKVMLDKWEKLVQEDPEVSVEMFEHVGLMTLDSIMKCAFSVQSSCQVDRDNSYIKTIDVLSSLVYDRTKKLLHQSDLIYWFSSQGRQFRKACKLAHLHTDRVIKERQEALRNEQELEKIQKKRRLDFLDILLCAKDEEGNPLSDEDLRAEVDTFMFGGHDTVSSGISWLFYCMAQNPEHQQRCREEIKELLGDQETIQWDDLGKMTYTTMCIKESLRLYPPVTIICRELSSPITFHDGRTLPEGFFAAVCLFAIHRNPEVWENPEAFEPMRFSPENSSSRHPYAFLPFSAGPRNCIGQQFAMLEMKVALALTLLRFELKPDPAKPSIPVIQIVTKSVNGVHLKLKKHL
ncbi:uncharacterized protein LOC134405181 [Elgaria multicarinata webbii]|uniref:uncharacterized protein LOC134405181 n=1 Tax=Elgaria multicarinata webbii TaxID=159646 RepID=UPI002FCD16B7